jgi:hypothetical protein
MHQPAVTVAGDDAKPLFHPLPPSPDGGHSLPPVCCRSCAPCAKTKKIRTNPLIFLNSVPEMQRNSPRQPEFPQNREILAI